jgi:DNA-binding NarL/FixJ family response regulator
MASNTVLPVSTAKRGARPHSQIANLPLSSAASIQELKTEALRCQTPKQFRELLKHLQAFIPYSKFAGSWGYPSRTTVRFIFNQGFSRDLIRWRLTTGALWTSPLFQEWLRTKRTVLWCDAVKHLESQFDAELLRQMKQAGAQYALCGGFASPDYYVLFAAAMPSAASGRAHLKQFGSIVPFLVQASQRAYPRALLTKRETAVLERRAMGQITKQIAMSEGISERTIREHFQRIKKKLYTDDLVNAVVIAVKSGMLLPTGGNEGVSGDPHRRNQGPGPSP